MRRVADIENKEIKIYTWTLPNEQVKKRMTVKMNESLDFTSDLKIKI